MLFNVLNSKSKTKMTQNDFKNAITDSNIEKAEFNEPELDKDHDAILKLEQSLKESGMI